MIACSVFRLSLIRATVLVIALAAAGCASSPRYGSAPTPAPHYKVGKAYKINGRWYHPAHDPSYDKVGVASWYGRDFHGRKTANGEIYNMNAMTAAHPTLPMPSLVEVKNLENGRKITVRVNDRGPFANDRIIDLSRAAARRLGFEQKGLARVRVRYVGVASLGGGRQLAASQPRRPSPRRTASAAPITEAVNGLERMPPPARPDRPRSSNYANETKATPGLASEPQTSLPALENTENSTMTAKPGNTVDAVGIQLASGQENEVLVEPALATRAKADAFATAPRSSQAPISVSLAPSSTDTQSATTLYAIRVAALSNLDNIEGLRAALGADDPLRFTRIETGGGKVFYRINMGPYNNVDTATKRLEEVREAGYGDAKLITIKP